MIVIKFATTYSSLRLEVKLIQNQSKRYTQHVNGTYILKGEEVNK